jgi:predicted AAA+ superfamily ATPase
MARKPQRTRRRYEHRLILFIDFLGFKEHVAHTKTDESFLDISVAPPTGLGAEA